LPVLYSLGGSGYRHDYELRKVTKKYMSAELAMMNLGGMVHQLGGEASSVLSPLGLRLGYTLCSLIIHELTYQPYFFSNSHCIIFIKKETRS
jgi:hypothetical protein